MGNSPSTYRKDFEIARKFDEDLFMAKNDNFLKSDDDFDRNNACAAYLVVKFGFARGFSRQNIEIKGELHEFIYDNFKMGDKIGSLISLEFHGVHGEVYTRRDVSIRPEYHREIKRILKNVRDENEDPSNVPVFNSWKTIYRHMWRVCPGTTPGHIRGATANRLFEEQLRVIDKGERLRSDAEVQGKLREAIGHVSYFLHHRNILWTKNWYIDPRTIAQWCKRNGYNVEAVLKSPNYKWAKDEVRNMKFPFEFFVECSVDEPMSCDDYMSWMDSQSSNEGRSLSPMDFEN